MQNQKRKSCDSDDSSLIMKQEVKETPSQKMKFEKNSTTISTIKALDWLNKHLVCIAVDLKEANGSSLLETCKDFYEDYISPIEEAKREILEFFRICLKPHVNTSIVYGELISVLPLSDKWSVKNDLPFAKLCFQLERAIEYMKNLMKRFESLTSEEIHRLICLTKGFFITTSEIISTSPSIKYDPILHNLTPSQMEFPISGFRTVEKYFDSCLFSASHFCKIIDEY